MKMLVIGIDGGDRRIIDAMDMSYLKSFIHQAICLDVTEDLWSRGWAEILSGNHGRETGAFYSKPELNGSHRFTQAFGGNSYKDNNAIEPLWFKLSKKRCSIGFMNVPTTMPAPEVNGFFISGAGAGIGKVEVITPSACFPKEAQDNLEKIDYIWDTRFMTSGIRDASEFLNRLNEMQKKRTEAFILLCKKYRPEFGFLAYMGTQRIQYLAMSEIETLIRNYSLPQKAIQKGILALYQSLDQCVALLLQELDPDHIMVVSDHGAAPYLTSVNVNNLLKKLNLQKQLRPQLRNSALRISHSVLSPLEKFVPCRIKQKMKSSIKQVGAIASAKTNDVDWDKTLAFGARYISGIYINDKKRFGGPVMSKKTIDDLTMTIIDKFNATEEAHNYNLYARPYRQVYKDSRYSEFLPDVWIDHPDTVFFEGHGKFVSPNPHYGPIKDLRNVKKDMYTGIKGRRPILCIEKSASQYIEKPDSTDLSIAYRIIDRVMLS